LQKIITQKFTEGVFPTMARIKRGVNKRKKKKKVLKQAKGYYGAKSKLYRTAKSAVMKSLMFSYIGRKLRKRDFRKLWIARINAATRLNGLSYSKFMHGLKLANVTLNRKMLADIAVQNPQAFIQLVSTAKQHLEKASKATASAKTK